MTYMHLHFPRGFTVRDLVFIYGVIRNHVSEYEPGLFLWNAEGIDFDDFNFDKKTLDAIRDDFILHGWDVRPVMVVWESDGDSERGWMDFIDNAVDLGGEGE